MNITSNCVIFEPRWFVDLDIALVKAAVSSPYMTKGSSYVGRDSMLPRKGQDGAVIR